MRLLSYAEFTATLALWNREERPILGFFMTMGQIAIGRVVIGQTEEHSPSVRIVHIVKELSWADEEPKKLVRFSEDKLLAAWHATTFNAPPSGSLIADHFDEQLQITLRDDVSLVTLYRASAFKAPSTNLAVG